MVNYKFMSCCTVLLAAPIHEDAERVTQNIGQAAASAATMRVDCGQLYPGMVIQPVPGQWHPRMPWRHTIAR
jgi:hypothetical protein